MYVIRRPVPFLLSLDFWSKSVIIAHMKSANVEPAKKGILKSEKQGVFDQRSKVAIYARVSTADQASIPAQLAACRSFCLRQGWDIAQEVSDVASGAKRRALREALLAKAYRGEVQAIVVTRLDRWGRSTEDLLSTLAELQARGIKLVSLGESLDTSTPSGKLFVTVMAAVCEFERNLLRERVRDGIAAARKRGVKLGRPSKHLDKADSVRELAAQGQTALQISRDLEMDRSAVRRILAKRATAALCWTTRGYSSAPSS